ncbi:MAG: nuclear transport factor 2 family protein [Usitatibacter sp.]
MPALERLNSLIAAVKAGRYAEAIRDFYHEDATMQENGKPPRVGRAALIANEERAMARVASIRTISLEAFFAGGDNVAIRSVYEIVGRDGRRTGLDEMCFQRWRGDRIAEERFYYDPAQFGSKAEANKQLMQGAFDELAGGNSKPFVEALAPDIRWTVGGTYTAKRMTAEGDFVVVECRGEVTTVGGKPYNNEYCWVCRIENGKISELTEYMDTALASAALTR